ncbi:MAG: hypothetical protein K0R29_1466 [Pseudobdellovibrio sp.]|jgi:hypothetical protein|nr:hypothetical protein [Pseudobdellovibrio sp.]
MKKFVKVLFLIFAVTGVVAQFQNCAKKEAAFTDEIVEETFSFFSYRYEKATPIYYELQIIPVSSDATYQTYKLILFAANSDGGAADIQYEFEIFDSAGKSMCALKTGSLSGGVSRVEESCIALKASVLGRALVKVRNPGGAWEVLNESYIN